MEFFVASAYHNELAQFIRADDHIVIWFVAFVFRHIGSFPAIPGMKKGVQVISDLNAICHDIAIVIILLFLFFGL